MNDQQIKNFIVKTLMDNGYGKTAAEMQVSAITEILVSNAYEQGRIDEMDARSE